MSTELNVLSANNATFVPFVKSVTSVALRTTVLEPGVIPIILDSVSLLKVDSNPT